MLRTPLVRWQAITVAVGTACYRLCGLNAVSVPEQSQEPEGVRGGVVRGLGPEGPGSSPSKVPSASPVPLGSQAV